MDHPPPTSIHWVNLIEEGLTNIGEHDPNSSDVSDELNAVGLKVHYLTLGEYDLVAIT